MNPDDLDDEWHTQQVLEGVDLETDRDAVVDLLALLEELLNLTCDDVRRCTPEGQSTAAAPRAMARLLGVARGDGYTARDRAADAASPQDPPRTSEEAVTP